MHLSLLDKNGFDNTSSAETNITVILPHSISSKRQSSNEAGVKEELGEFETVMQTRDEVCLEFSQPLVFISGYENTENVFHCFNNRPK